MRMTAKQYAQTLYDLTDRKSKPEVEKSVVDFAHYIYKERKLKFAEKIIEQFAAIYNKEKGVVEAEVITAQKLESSQADRVRSCIKEKYGVKEVILKNLVDKNIRGGIILSVGDEVIDKSIRGKLNNLRDIITK